MTDRELLERAAKAAGIVGTYMEVWGDTGIAPDRPDGGLWNPLTDDGDALRLAVRLNFLIHYSPEFERHMGEWSLQEIYDADPNDCTRRAIVHAAAAIGGHTA